METYKGPKLVYGDAKDGSGDVLVHTRVPVSDLVQFGDDHAVKLKNVNGLDGLDYVFYRNGGIEEFHHGKLVGYWYPKPTIKEAVELRGHGLTYTFHRDETVTLITKAREKLRWGKKAYCELMDIGEVVHGQWYSGVWMFWDKLTDEFRRNEVDMGDLYDEKPHSWDDEK